MRISTPMFCLLAATAALLGPAGGAAAQDGPTGACCFPDGQCFDFPEELCNRTNGDYRGDGVACVDADCQCTADIDGSGNIAFQDLLQVLANWGPCPKCPADLNDDGEVDVLDLLSVLVVLDGPCFPAPAEVEVGDSPVVAALNYSAIVGTPPGLNSWRVSAVFENNTDTVLAVVAHPTLDAIAFETDDPAGLTNDCIIEQHGFDDFPSAEGICARYDSYMTIGIPVPDNGTTDTPGFLGGDGNRRVIEGVDFQDGNGGWFDTTPGATGPGVDLAQLTVGDNFDVRLAGVVIWQPEGLPGYVATPFDVESSDASPVGGCCIRLDECLLTTAAGCAAFGGTYLGDGVLCAIQEISVDIVEPGGDVFTHVIAVIATCPEDGGAPGGCLEGPRIDPWKSPAKANMVQNFGVEGSPAIPADFFDTGSDPFTGGVPLEGVPLGPVDIDEFENVEFGDADTLVRRSDDPFDRCELPSPDERLVDIEIVALSLVSTDPIVVTFNGGQDPEEWAIAVDLSVIHTDEDPNNDPPLGMFAARKEHCNGGTYTSTLFVNPRYTFTRVDDGEIRVLDTGLAGLDAVMLDASQTPQSWVHDLNAGLDPQNPFCTELYGGFSEPFPELDCDCNANQVRDTCDIEQGTSNDCNGNGIPDDCEPPIPCPANFDGDCIVGFNDLLLLLNAWGPCPDCPEDLDDDDDVDFQDLLLLLSGWGPCFE